MRRASSSVAATIAEATGRPSWKDFARFLAMARGSAHEMIGHFVLASDLKYVSDETAAECIRRYQGLAAGIYAYMKKITGP